jgi:predicted PurR-regulated permease PerM
VLILVFWGIIAFLRSDAGSLPNLLQKMAEIIEGSRGRLPEWLLESIPGDPDALKSAIAGWLAEHARELRTIGGEVGHAAVHVLIGMVIGAMVSLHEVLPDAAKRPLARELGERTRRLGDSFRRIVFAQVRISALNSVLTAIYLVGLLPLFGVHLPYAKTLIAVTFIAGLLPVIGNLISNSVIVIVSLAVSLEVAMGSLAFLVIVHKLEYFLNARIVGGQIRAAAWELLLAMLVMEAAFGIPGVVAAPIYYAYLKDELAARELI